MTSAEALEVQSLGEKRKKTLRKEELSLKYWQFTMISPWNYACWLLGAHDSSQVDDGIANSSWCGLFSSLWLCTFATMLSNYNVNNYKSRKSFSMARWKSKLLTIMSILLPLLQHNDIFITSGRNKSITYQTILLSRHTSLVASPLNNNNSHLTSHINGSSKISSTKKTRVNK